MNEMRLSIEPLIPALRRYARALVRNSATADDLVQDCLERAVSRWHQRREGELRPWLFAILHNLAVSQFRQLATRGQHVALDAATEGDLEQDAVQEKTLMYQDVLDRLAKLPEDQRRESNCASSNHRTALHGAARAPWPTGEVAAPPVPAVRPRYVGCVCLPAPLR